jgi:ABC-2 type transport system ATP-binding protein
VRVLGADPERTTRDWRARIGVALQTVQQDELLTVRETLEEYAGFYPAPCGVGRTLEDVGLVDQRDRGVH